SPEGRLYRYISTPVAGATVADWQDNFAITGNFAGASTTAASGEDSLCGFKIIPTTPSLFFYENSNATYVAYPSASNTEPLVPGRGYAAFIRQCNFQTKIDVTGPINRDSIPLPVNHNGT